MAQKVALDEDTKQKILEVLEEEGDFDDDKGTPLKEGAADQQDNHKKEDDFQVNPEEIKAEFEKYFVHNREPDVSQLQSGLFFKDHNDAKTAKLLRVREEGTRRSLLHYALLNAKESLVRLIVKQKDAPLHLLDSEGYTPLQLAVNKRRTEIIRQFLAWLSPSQVAEVINVNSENPVYSGYTAIHFSCYQKHYEMTDILLMYGANPTAKADNRQTPLHVLASHPPTSTIDLPILVVNRIQEKGGSPKHQIEHQDETGVNPLMVACAKGNADLVNYFLEFRPDVHLKDQFGDTALHHAFNIQLQKVFDNNWTVLPSFHECAFGLVKNGAQITAVNEANITPLNFASDALRAILTFASEPRNAKIVNKYPTLQDFITGFESNPDIDSSDKAQLAPFARNLQAEQDKLREDEANGGCCRLITKKTDSTAAESDKLLGSILGDQPTSTATPSSATEESKGASCPFSGKSSEDPEARCPFSMFSQKETPATPATTVPTTPAFEEKSPVAVLSPSTLSPSSLSPSSPSAPLAQTSRAIKLESKHQVVKKEEAQCPIPYHREMMKAFSYLTLPFSRTYLPFTSSVMFIAGALFLAKRLKY